MIYSLLKYNDEGNLSEIFSFDSITSYSESWVGTVSKSTTEHGFPLSDHINIENPVFTINATFSDYSLFQPDNEIFWDGEDFTSEKDDKSLANSILLKKEIIGMFVNRGTFHLYQTSENSFSRDGNARFAELKSSYIQHYENCVITSIDVDESESISNAYSIKLKIEQLNIARVSTRALKDNELQPALKPKLAKSPDNVGTSSTSGTDTGTDPSKTVAQKANDKGAVTTEMNKKNPYEQAMKDLTAERQAVDEAMKYQDRVPLGIATVDKLGEGIFRLDMKW